MRPAAHEARTKNRVGIPCQDRFEQDRIFVWIVFEIGVLNDNDLAGGGGESGAQGRAFPLIARPIDNLVAEGRDFLTQDVGSSVGRAIVDDNDFDILKRGRANGANDLFNGFPFIETGNDDGDFHRICRLS